MASDGPDDGNHRAGLLSRTEAFRHFAAFDGPTQSQQHIKPLHEYVTTRLVLEGGFAPDELRPHPPLRVIRSRRGANRADQDTPTTDIALTAPAGQPVEALVRFHAALTEMTGRLGVRNDMSRYEAVGMALVDMRHGSVGQPVEGFPPVDSRVHFVSFFDMLYQRYDERYVIGAPQLKSRTRRTVWAADSPALSPEALPTLDYTIRADTWTTPAHRQSLGCLATGELPAKLRARRPLHSGPWCQHRSL